MIDSVREFLDTYLTNPYLRALVILIGSVIAAKLADILISGTLKLLASRTDTDLDDKVIQRLHGPIFKTVFLAGAYLAVSTLDPGDRLRYWLGGLLGTFLLVLWARALYDVSTLFLRKASGSDRVDWMDAQSEPLFENLSFILLWAISLYVLLVVWDLDAKPWLASAGVAGIAIGFAAKDTLANLIGGFFVLIDKPYKIGDYVNLDSGERGRVTNIGLRSTRLLTRDDIEVTIPNAVVGNAKIVNETGGPYAKQRVTLRVGVAYGSDVDAVRRVLLESAEVSSMVVARPEPRVRFTAFGESSLDFRLLCWIDDPAHRGMALDELHTEVYRRFGSEGIAIPFPQRDVHLRSGDAAG